VLLCFDGSFGLPFDDVEEKEVAESKLPIEDVHDVSREGSGVVSDDESLC